MVDRLEFLLRKFRRAVSRSEWGARALGHPLSMDTETEPGLVLVQIDGLSEGQLRKGLEDGKMPFLQGLLANEDYRIASMYSGVPSTTPSVQGELFYGVNQAVPAFSFVDRATGRLVKMYEREPASSIEASFEGNEPLLKDGVAYTNIYSGGAADSRFCAASGNISDFTRMAKPWIFPVLLFMHGVSVVRMLGLLVAEIFWAAGGVVRGLLSGFDLLAELKFIPSRVLVCIGLRDMVTIGAKVDIARGVPVVQLNLLSYDEHAHRRGPSSYFAHWGLKGIDDSIKRLTRAARRSTRRDYDVWVYSDHGQEDTTPYVEAHGRTIQEAIADIAGVDGDGWGEEREPAQGIQMQRTNLFGEAIARRLLAGATIGSTWTPEGIVFTAAMGPLGHVYFPEKLSDDRKVELAGRIAEEAYVPLILWLEDSGKVQALLRGERKSLPEDAPSILGDSHPYLEDVTGDLLSLCRHPNAGDLILSGWRPDEKPLSFPRENGAHAGPGPEETSAFIALPRDIEIPVQVGETLRPRHLRDAALEFLERKPVHADLPRDDAEEDARTLRVMTYNVHSCIGMDGKMSPRRIARVIARYRPDVVAMQELDAERPRTGGVEQAHLIAQELDMHYHFHPVMTVEEEKYGNAILSRHPFTMMRSEELPRLQGWKSIEPRGAMWIQLELNGEKFNIINTHLGLHRHERLVQAESLLSDDWLNHPECSENRILLGDFNASPKSETCRMLSTLLTDCQEDAAEGQQSTWFGRMPMRRIDHIFHEGGMDVKGIVVPRTEMVHVASDHLPLIADFNLETD